MQAAAIAQSGSPCDSSVQCLEQGEACDPLSAGNVKASRDLILDLGGVDLLGRGPILILGAESRREKEREWER